MLLIIMILVVIFSILIGVASSYGLPYWLKGEERSDDSKADETNDPEESKKLHISYEY